MNHIPIVFARAVVMEKRWPAACACVCPTARARPARDGLYSSSTPWGPRRRPPLPGILHWDDHNNTYWARVMHLYMNFLVQNVSLLSDGPAYYAETPNKAVLQDLDIPGAVGIIRIEDCAWIRSRPGDRTRNIKVTNLSSSCWPCIDVWATIKVDFS